MAAKVTDVLPEFSAELIAALIDQGDVVLAEQIRSCVSWPGAVAETVPAAASTSHPGHTALGDPATETWLSTAPKESWSWTS